MYRLAGFSQGEKIRGICGLPASVKTLRSFDRSQPAVTSYIHVSSLQILDQSDESLSRFLIIRFQPEWLHYYPSQCIYKLYRCNWFEHQLYTLAFTHIWSFFWHVHFKIASSFEWSQCFVYTEKWQDSSSAHFFNNPLSLKMFHDFFKKSSFCNLLPYRIFHELDDELVIKPWDTITLETSSPKRCI